ncbi:MAG: putative bifunctional diguanylate cyclase/phosphodiesterase, partial [Blastocatellia bacterium]
IQHIADRKRAEERLLHEAMHDSLTGLPNRVYFLAKLQSELAAVKDDSSETVAVLFLDLDRFKVINDSLGHLYGDRLLVETAARLRASIRTNDLVARLGGDEFTVLLTGVQGDNDAIRVAERIQRDIAIPFKLGAYETCATASIGIAIYRRDHIPPEEMLRDADTAMYQAKALGKGQHAIFDRYMHTRAMNMMQIENDLRRGLEREEFLLHYQPIVEIESGRLLGFEALVRWLHPERGLIPPGTFIPVAEETGWIVPLGAWVLREACAQMKLWQEQFGIDSRLYVAVNISSKQFGQVDIPDQVTQTLRSTGLDARSLTLEITESVVMDNIEVATRILERLRSIGVELSIDDFGTGYSSLSYLHRLPINVLKIDRSFVNRLGKSKADKEIVRTIVLMAQTLGKGVVAEGVETEEQLAELRELKCGCGQGFLFSRPVGAEAAGQFVWNFVHGQGLLTSD